MLATASIATNHRLLNRIRQVAPYTPHLIKRSMRDCPQMVSRSDQTLLQAHGHGQHKYKHAVSQDINKNNPHLTSVAKNATTILWSFIWDRKKHSPTHTYPNQSSFIGFLHLLCSIASSLFNLCASQFFRTTSLQVLFGLPLGLELSRPRGRPFLHPIIVFFSQHMPIPLQSVLLQYRNYVIQS